jgi:hypothetical protein
MADARLVIDVVGAPERRELAEEISSFVGELRGAEPVDRFRPDFSRIAISLAPISSIACPS